MFGRQKKIWYFNTLTEQPEKGKLSRIENRMGPYATREEALRAWKIAKERDKKWEEDSKKWKEDWENLGKSQENEQKNGQTPSDEPQV